MAKKANTWLVVAPDGSSDEVPAESRREALWIKFRHSIGWTPEDAEDVLTKYGYVAIEKLDTTKVLRADLAMALEALSVAGVDQRSDPYCGRLWKALQVIEVNGEGV